MALVIQLALRSAVNRPLTWSEGDTNLSNLRQAAVDLDSRIVTLEGASPTDVQSLIDQKMQDHVVSADPHSQYLQDVPDDWPGGYVRKLGQWVRAVTSGGGGGGEVDLSVRTYTTDAVAGAFAQESINLTVNPPANSTAVSIGQRITTQIDTDKNLTTGASVGAFQTVVNAGGTGFIDKLVGHLSHINFAGTGRKESALCFEAGIPTVPANSNIGSVCGFYFPNLAGIPNINRIGTLAAFANQHRKGLIQNMGVYLDSLLRQVVPPRHPGMVANRSYTSPYRWIGYSGYQVGQIMMTMIYIPKRVVVSALGIGVNGAVAGAKLRLAMYSAIDGAVGQLMGQTAELDAATAGAKEGATNFEVDGGMYFLGVMANMAIQISTHASQSSGDNASLYGQTNPLASDGSTERSAFINAPYGTWPPVAALVPNYLANDSEAHIWMKRA